MTKQEKEIETFCPVNRKDWRQWLQKNHQLKQAVWLVHYKKKSSAPNISWSEAVDEAICFGWIDSVRKSLDAERYIQFFSKRKSSSVWSKINKEKVQYLINEGLMTKEGFPTIEAAKQNGTWFILDDVEKLTIPNDLEKAFKANKSSKDFFLSLNKSVKKSILQWLVLAKRPETRQKRINEIAELAARQLMPNNFR